MTSRLTYTVSEAAQLLGISRNSAYECVRRGELPSVTLGRRIVIPHAQLEQLLCGRRDSASSSATLRLP